MGNEMIGYVKLLEVGVRIRVLNCCVPLLAHLFLTCSARPLRYVPHST